MNTSSYKLPLVIGGIFATAMMLLAFLAGSKYMTPIADGSTIVGNDYMSTTTSTGRFSALPIDLRPTTTPITGSLSSISVTGPTLTGRIDIYDATTSDVNLRTGNPATSTLLLFSLPAGTATSSWTGLDLIYKVGLLIDVQGTMPTTTITFR